MLSEYEQLIAENRSEPKDRRCHNCGIKDDKSTPGLRVRINSIIGWFCEKSCFDEWNHGKNYEGGLISTPPES